MKKILSNIWRRVRQTRWARILLSLLSVMLAGTYPAFYYYTRNVATVLISSFWRLLPFYLLIILLVYGVALAFNKFNTVKAANAATVFLFFFNTYGLVYDLLLGADFVRVDHLTLLPLYIFLAIYCGWLVARLNKTASFSLLRIVSVIFVVLTALSIVRIIPHEIRKAELKESPPHPVSVNVQEDVQSGPDIYYLVFDEFAGFQSMQEYWQNLRAEDFRSFLEGKGFFIADESRSGDVYSIHQIATRLNYFDYAYIKGEDETWLAAIANNNTMSFLDSKGYTTVVVETFSWFFPAMPEIQADYVYDIKMFETILTRIVYDDFAILVMDGTMLYPVSHQGKYLETKYDPLRKLAVFASEEIPTLEEVSSPKFVYLHALMPHNPFLYDEEGQRVSPEFYKDWGYYEGYYNYTIAVIQDMVTDILENSDPDNPPVIILQSDHGARVKENDRSLPDFPQEFQQDILFAYYLPGYDTSQLPPDIDPINTFPIVFNHYFDANIPLQ